MLQRHGEIRPAALGQADVARARQHPAASVGAGDLADAHHLASDLGVDGEVLQVEPDGEVLVAAFGERRVAGDLGRVQRPGQLTGGRDVAGQPLVAADEQVPERAELAVGGDLALHGTGAGDRDAEGRPLPRRPR